MRRTSHTLTVPQDEKLRAISKTTGLSVSDLIRRAIDAMLDREEEKKQKAK